jgi:DNA-3-methyladenine glycosylase
MRKSERPQTECTPLPMESSNFLSFQRIKAGELPTATIELARALIGVVLVHHDADGLAAGRIVETEAYPLRDPASHAFIGRRPRNAAMFLKPHHAYVYLIYGTAYCFNVTSEEEGEGAAVLVRALEPLDGLALMERRRGTRVARDVCRGPGRLAQALGIDRALDGRDLMADPKLWLAHGDGAGAVGTSRRIGITKAADRRLRFYLRGNPFVSGPQKLSP